MMYYLFKHLRVIQSLFLSLILFCGCLCSTCVHIFQAKADDLLNDDTLAEYEEIFNDLEFLSDNTFDSFDYSLNNGVLIIDAMKLYSEEFLEDLEEYYNIGAQTEVFYEIMYDDNCSAVLIDIYISDKNDSCKLIRTIPGLLTYNPEGEKDIMITIENDYYWFSDIEQLMSDYFGGVSSCAFMEGLATILDFVIELVDEVLTEFVDTIAEILHPVLDKSVEILYSIEVESFLEVSAWLLSMNTEKRLTCAGFDCWQQYFGYIDLYDTVFDAGTSMRSAKFPFDINDDGIDDFIFWAWKGDYLNLGAGAEMGIYRHWVYSDNIWLVDKKFAMEMSLTVSYQGTEIFSRENIYHWWITGFYLGNELEYLDVDRDDLTARYKLFFNTSDYPELYTYFKNDFHLPELEEGDPTSYIYNFDDYNKTWTFQF